MRFMCSYGGRYSALFLGGHDVVIVGLLVAAHFWFILYRAERLLRIAAERTNKEQGG